jgi:hypothetical protein
MNSMSREVYIVNGKINSVQGKINHPHGKGYRTQRMVNMVPEVVRPLFWSAGPLPSGLPK